MPKLAVRVPDREGDTLMKTFCILVVAAFFAVSLAWAAQSPKEPIPKYDPAQERTFKGTIDAVHDRACPVSGGVGSHIMLKLDDRQILEVHLGNSSFVKEYDLTFAKGESLEVIGVQVKFEGSDTIFAREIKRGGDLYMFRDKDGKPIW